MWRESPLNKSRPLRIKKFLVSVPPQKGVEDPQFGNFAKKAWKKRRG